MEKRRAYMGKGYKRKAMKRKRRIVRWAIIGVLGVVLVFTFNRGAEGRSGILNSGIKGEKASAYIDLQPVQAGECDPEILGKLPVCGMTITGIKETRSSDFYKSG